MTMLGGVRKGEGKGNTDGECGFRRTAGKGGGGRKGLLVPGQLCSLHRGMR